MIQRKRFGGKVEKIIRDGGIGIIPTDTIYGMVGSAMSKKAVNRIYKLRFRDSKKPFIILISSLNDLARFNIKTDSETKKILNCFWPGKVSIVLPCSSKEFLYLHPVRSKPPLAAADVQTHRTSNGVHRGAKTLAFRMPKDKDLIELIKKTGPLVAPSANPEGLPPAKTIKQAKKYFGDNVDFYVGVRKLSGRPSTLIKINGDKVVVLRQGVVKIK
ncbi:L-threonylcarbamoyladenylate synthase [Candidatus Wolfebacteria bacterium]|nr:L-threonylcarbamoyladenylate synthase [Candidatus Wolfebacteria bacterium]